MLSRNSAVDTPSPVGPGNQWGEGGGYILGLEKGSSNLISSIYPDSVSHSYLVKHGTR